jgi:DNA invertase Pin-like site-specific DNA recombinase
MKSDEYKVGIYIRLSKEDEDKINESESITNQRNYILDYLKNNDFILYKEYIDDGYSGTDFDRPSFKKMISDIENKKINMVITKDMSRLGREMSESCYYIEKYFPEKKVRYIAINDSIDTYIDCLGNDMIGFKAVFNDWYAKDISKKIKSSLTTKKKQGKFLGAHAPYGYLKDPNDKYHLIIDSYASEVVKTIYNMFINGDSLKKIARYLTLKKIPKPSIYKKMNYNNIKTKNIWDERTINDILKNPNYTGNLTQCRRKKVNHKSKKIISTSPSEWIRVKNTHEAIIDQETYDLVQIIYSKNKNRNSKSTNLLLRGFLYCKECGHTIGINKSSDNKRYYTICNHYRKYSKNSFCTCHSMNYKDLEVTILNHIKKTCEVGVNMCKLENSLKKNLYKSKKLDEIDNRIIRIKNIISNNKKNIQDMYIDKLNGVISLKMYNEIQNKLLGEISVNQDLLKQLEQEKKKSNKNDNYHDYYNKVKDYVSFKKTSRNLLASIIDKITIDENKNIEIYYKIKPSFSSMV